MMQSPWYDEHIRLFTRLKMRVDHYPTGGVLAGRFGAMSGGEMTYKIETLYASAFVFVLASSAAAGTAWNVDFQGDNDHLGLFGQTDPVDHTEPGIVWNAFEVQAFNSTTSSEFESNTSMNLLDENGTDNGVALSFTGDLVGWSGSSGANSLVGDFLILASFAGIDTSTVSWAISGLDPSATYNLTFYSHNDNNPVRGINFVVNGAAPFSQTNANPPVTIQVISSPGGGIAGTATNLFEPDAEGDWAGLQIEQVPEPAAVTIALLGLIGLFPVISRMRG